MIVTSCFMTTDKLLSSCNSITAALDTLSTRYPESSFINKGHSLLWTLDVTVLIMDRK